MTEQTEIVIIGAGPSGAVAAAMLRAKGRTVIVLEQTHFPRFSIGESLLPQCMEFLAQAGMDEAVHGAGFQHKNGAAFTRNGNYTEFDFREKFSPGPGTTYQVQRAKFDQLLAEQAAKYGADIRFGHRLTRFEYEGGRPRLSVSTDTDQHYTLTCDYVLDASGFGRVLPRLLNLDIPSSQAPRTSMFTHIRDNISDPSYDRDKILIAIHPEYKEVWYWLIPFSNGRCSIGVVARDSYFREDEPAVNLKRSVTECHELAALLKNAEFDTPVNRISSYSCNVSSMWGQRFALLGNAGEFLDPVFSSGVTIAMKSASLIAPLVDRQLQGDTVDWEAEYAVPLRLGVETFRTFVNAWYDGSFQDVVFANGQQRNIREMISSILAGYAWDDRNPYVRESSRRLNALAAICK